MDIKKYNIIVLLLILALAFLARVYFFSQEGSITADGVSYVLSGKNLIENGRFEKFGNPELIFPPGYPIFIGIADHFFNNLLFSSRFISFISGILIVYLTYLVGREVGGEKSGLFVALLAATNWTLIVLSQESWSESIYLLFVLITVYLYLQIIKKNKLKLAMLFGISSGLSYLIRPEGLLLLLLAFAFPFKKNKNFDFKKSIQCSVITILIFMVVVAPYIYFLYKNTGELKLTTKTESNLIAGNLLDGEEMGVGNLETGIRFEKAVSNYDEETNSIKLPEGVESANLNKSIFSNFDKFQQRYFKALFLELDILFSELWVVIFLIIVSIIGIFSIRKIRKDTLIIFIMPGLFLLIFPIFHIESRYMMQVYIFLAILAGLGYSFFDDFSFLIGKRWSGFGLIFFKFMKFFIPMLVFVQFFATVSYYRDFLKSTDHSEYKIAAERIKGDLSFKDGKDIIMSRKPFVSFYAGSKKGSVGIPYAEAENIIKFAKANKVNYVIIDERYLKIRENYEELLNLGDYSKDSELIFEDDSIRPIRIFKMKYDN